VIRRRISCEVFDNLLHVVSQVVNRLIPHTFQQRLSRLIAAPKLHCRNRGIANLDIAMK
jgi:hypothetical protein